MSVSTTKPCPETRPILASTGNQVRLLEQEQKCKTKKPVEKLKVKKIILHSPVKKQAAAAAVVVKSNASADNSSVDSSSSSSSSLSMSSGKNVKPVKKVGGVKRVKSVTHAKVVLMHDGDEAVRRCDWITPNSEPIYTTFHDEEWGVPVHDDVKLFELLVYSIALAELSWPDILNKRPIFRKLFDDFNPSSIANFNGERLQAMRVNGKILLSEQKLRAIVENAKQLLKIQNDFGSFSNYCWRFVNNKTVKNEFRNARQIPAKTPKSELISKDLMRRGFRCVGPTVMYSFMQVAGIVNDHLITCFRYNECGEKNTTVLQEKREQEQEALLNKTCSSDTCVVLMSCPPD